MAEPMYFEDWKIGEVFETAERVVTSELAHAFGEIEGSKGALHLDEEFARTQSIFGALTAHGLLTLSMAAGMMGESGMFEGTGLAFLDLTWKFHAPVVIGDSIRVRWWVASKKETSKPERGVITREIEVYNGDVLACTGTMTSLWARRLAAAAA